MDTICLPENTKQLKSFKKRPTHLTKLLFNDDMIISLPVSSEGNKYPHGFASWKAFSINISRLMKRIMKYDPEASITLYGSSIQGYRLKSKKGKGLWFDEDSDYDVAIISKKLFERVERKLPRLISKNGVSSRVIPLATEDRILAYLYDGVNDWPRSTHFTVYNDIYGVLDNCLLSLHVKSDSNGIVSETYLFGKDIYHDRIIGDLHEVLVKYGKNYVDCSTV